MADSAQVFNNLVAHTYIYSHTSHFQSDLDNRIAFGRSHKVNRVFTLDKLIDVRNQLMLSVKAITDRTNQFYEDMGLLGRDKIDIKDEGLLIDLSGAREFERKYLMGNANGGANIKDRTGEITDIMVSVEYQQEVYKRLKANVTINTEVERIATDFFNDVAGRNLDSAAVKSLTRAVQNGTFNALSGVDILFSTKGNRDRGTDTLTQIQQKLLKEFLNTMGKDKGVFASVVHNKDNLKKLRNSLKREIAGNVFTLNEVSETMFEVLIEKLRSRGVKISQIQSEAIKQVFMKELKPALKEVLKHGSDTNLIDFEVRDARLNGLILEQAIALSINTNNLFNLKKLNTKKINETIAKVTGQERNEKGQQIKADLQVVGKSGRVYDIQAKNSFSTRDYDAIHLQANIKVETFAKQIFTDKYEEQLFEFFILNRAFLSRAGLENVSGPKGEVKTASSPLNTMSNETVVLMIQFFLNQAIFHLLGSKVQEMIGSDAQLQQTKNGNLDYGNLFFIFRKNYLIPVSVFLFSALNCLNQLIAKCAKNQSVDFLNSIGRLTYAKELSGFSENYTYTYNKQFRERKLEAIKDTGLSSGDDKYPDNLVQVGAEVGKRMLNDAVFKGVNFSLSIQKLNEILR